MEYRGVQITTNGMVYEPAEDSFLAAEMVTDELGKMEGDLSVIDMGCGSGILGIVAGICENVTKVVFADVSNEALDLARTNLQRNRDVIRAECDFTKSDLFGSVEGNFNLIIFNAPYLPEGKDDKLANAWYGGKSGIEVASEFVGQAVDHMKEGGKIILVVSSLGDLQALKQEISARELVVDREQKARIGFEDIIAMVLSKQYIMDFD